ncbi:hypothetical protein [Patulibacter defluvii]|uniref:hypothetical protein n=1 Tax=Patulibacter defluvii TaxID=3095358 RepID=UPI002A757EB5|nr:hypothetical protein [Patulibacter sp. DM4]
MARTLHPPRLRLATIVVLLLALVAVPTLAACGNDEKASKVEIVTRLGLAAGATKRWIVDPAREGGFAKGAQKRKRTIAKAVLAGGFTLRMLQKAKEEADQDPKLRKLLPSIASATAAITALKGALGGGDAGAISKLVGGGNPLDGLMSAARGQGLDVKEEVPSAAKLAGG